MPTRLTSAEFARWNLESTRWPKFSVWMEDNDVRAPASVTSTATTHASGEQFDPDINPVLGVSHRPVVILRSDEAAHLEFLFACGDYSGPGSCHPTATLYAE